MLALLLHFVLKACSINLHLPMLLLANLVSVPVEVGAHLICTLSKPNQCPGCARLRHDFHLRCNHDV